MLRRALSKGSVHHLAVVLRRMNTDLVEQTAVPVSRGQHWYV